MQAMVAIPVREAEDKEPLTAPGVYVAPPDYHLLDRAAGGCLALSTDEPGELQSPVDRRPLRVGRRRLRADVILAVLLTGANQDGARGLARDARRRGRCDRPGSKDRREPRDAYRRNCERRRGQRPAPRGHR